MRKKYDLEKIDNEFKKYSEDNYLKAILESYYEYNFKARLEIAEILYKAFAEVVDDNLKKNILAEVFAKLMQSCEDQALIAIMFSVKGKTPLEHYMSTENRQFYEFYGKARRGFSDTQILKMFGLESAESLLKKKLIEKSEVPLFQKELNLWTTAERNTWKGLGIIYTSSYINKGSGKIKFTKSGLVKSYFNIKHGFKVLHPTKTYQIIWPYNKKADPELVMIEEYEEYGKIKPIRKKELQKYANHKVIKTGILRANKRVLKLIFKKLYLGLQTVKFIAGFNLTKIDDPAFPVREMRWIIFKNYINTPLKHYDKCPCKSGKIYRKCHMLDNWHLDDLTYPKKENR